MIFQREPYCDHIIYVQMVERKLGFGTGTKSVLGWVLICLSFWRLLHSSLEPRRWAFVGYPECFGREVRREGIDLVSDGFWTLLDVDLDRFLDGFIFLPWQLGVILHSPFHLSKRFGFKIWLCGTQEPFDAFHTSIVLGEASRSGWHMRV